MKIHQLISPSSTEEQLASLESLIDMTADPGSTILGPMYEQTYMTTLDFPKDGSLITEGQECVSFNNAMRKIEVAISKNADVVVVLRKELRLYVLPPSKNRVRLVMNPDSGRLKYVSGPCPPRAAEVNYEST